MDFEKLGREIRDAEPGSDIHGLVEKMSYFLHIETPSNPAESNWFTAQQKLLQWSNYQYRNESPKFSLSNGIHDLLNHNAYDNHECRSFWDDYRSQFDDWANAQNDLASQVLHQVTII